MTTLPSDSGVRQQAVNIQKSVLLTAPAGSGKTSVLEQRFLKALAHCDAPEQVVAITFTVAAAGEIRERVLNTLKQAKLGTQSDSQHGQALLDDAKAVLVLDAEKGWGLLRDPSRLRIMTIDALNSLIASSLPLVSRSGGAVAVDTQPNLLYREAVINLFADLEDDSLSANLKNALSVTLEFGRHQIDRLIPLFETLLQARDQWLRPLMAGDASQFEQTFEKIIEATKSDAQHALSDDQWQLLLEILQDGSGFSDELAWAADIDTAISPMEQPGNLVQKIGSVLLTSEGKLRKKVNKRQGFRAGKDYTDRMNQLLKQLASTVGSRGRSAIEILVSIPDYAFDGEGLEMLDALSLVLLRLAAHLQVVFQNSGRVDFVEVHARAMEALNTDSDAHGDFLIREERIRHLLVDEMQDTSGAQIELIQRLTSEWSDGDERSLFLCGDPQQSIYGFRGGDVGQFLALWVAGRLGNKSFDCLALTNNFRSSPELVGFYNGVFTDLFGETSNRWTGQVPFSKAKAFRSDLTGQVSCVPFDHQDGDRLEASMVCDYLEAELGKDPESDIAVLVRSRSHLKAILPLMRERGIPASGEEIDHLSEKSAVSDCVTLIKAMSHLGDRAAWVALLRAPFVGLTWADCLKLLGDDKYSPVRQLLDDQKRLMGLSIDGRRRAFRLLAVLRRIEVSERWRDIVWRSRCLWESLGGLDVVDEHTASDINKVFMVLSECTEAGHLVSRTRFEHRLSRLFAASSGGQVKVMTIHNAKGLQFDKVCLVGLNKNTMQDTAPLIHWRSVGEDFLLVPASRVEGGQLAEQFSFLGSLAQQAAINEQKRLLYVALTRAKTELKIFAGVKVSAKGEVSVSKNTFLDMLLPYLDVRAEDVQAGGGLAAESGTARYVQVKKVASTYKGPTLSSGYHCKTPIAPALSEDATEQLSKREHAAQRAAGTVFHFLMERIAKEGMENWSAFRVKGAQKAIIALLRRSGCPDKYLDRATKAIIKWTIDTLSAKTGQWLLKSRSHRWFERKITGWRNGEFFSDIMDIVFIEGNTVWIIDYKSSLRGNASLSELVEANRGQLERYIETLRTHYPDKEVRAAVYVPMTQEVGELLEERMAA